MQQSVESHLRPFPSAIAYLVAAVAFAAAYGQAALYFSNQNQYFLHGLAVAGHGFLHEDWLANTLDPTPLFSALVEFTVRHLPPWVVHAYYAILMGVYAVAMLGLFAALVGDEVAARRWPIFVALVVLIHSAALRWCSHHLLGEDYPWYFQAGVANQYILGPMFQPSTFGVLLVVSLCLFVRGRPYLAAVFAAAAGTMHATYLLPAGLLTLGFGLTLREEKRPRQALGVLSLALILVVPIIVYSLRTFGATAPKPFGDAQHILANLRIPHHARIDRWLDEIAVLQALWVLLGTVLAWRTRLFAVLGVPLLLSVLLTLVQALVGDDGLALLFPWRVSAVLVPVATTVILSRLIALPSLTLSAHAARAIAFVALAIVATTGIVISVGQLGYRTPPNEVPLMEFVRRTKQPGDVYLLPLRVPNPANANRGARSSDFRPPLENPPDFRNAGFHLQRFRLYTGAPIFVDFKSIPYKDVEVIEWRDRLLLSAEVRALLDQGRLEEVLAMLRDRGVRVTHLIHFAERELAGPGIEQVYADSYYRVYRLSALAPARSASDE